MTQLREKQIKQMLCIFQASANSTYTCNLDSLGICISYLSKPFVACLVEGL